MSCLDFKSVLLILMLLAPFRLLSQTEEEFFYSINDNIGIIAELTISKKKVKIVKGVEDQLNFGVVQTNWTVYKRKKLLRTHLLTLSLSGKIFYKELYKTKFSEELGYYEVKNILLYMDSSVLKQVTEVALQNYGRTIDLDHIERLPNRSIFGYGCSYSGLMPLEGRRMLKLVEEKNSDKLFEWLASINPVKQAYSYLGLKVLESKGVVELDEPTLRIMKELEESSILIYSCSGCTLWEYLPMKVFLSEETVESFLEFKNENQIEDVKK